MTCVAKSSPAADVVPAGAGLVITGAVRTGFALNSAENAKMKVGKRLQLMADDMPLISGWVKRQMRGMRRPKALADERLGLTSKQDASRCEFQVLVCGQLGNERGIQETRRCLQQVLQTHVQKFFPSGIR